MEIDCHFRDHKLTAVHLDENLDSVIVVLKTAYNCPFVKYSVGKPIQQKIANEISGPGLYGFAH